MGVAWTSLARVFVNILHIWRFPPSINLLFQVHYCLKKKRCWHLGAAQRWAFALSLLSISGSPRQVPLEKILLLSLALRTLRALRALGDFHQGVGERPGEGRCEAAGGFAHSWKHRKNYFFPAEQNCPLLSWERRFPRAWAAAAHPGKRQIHNLIFQQQKRFQEIKATPR